MINKEIVQNPTLAAIVIFVGIYFITIWFFPDFLFENDGSIRQFGVGFQKKTILPIWLFTVFLGILSYLFVQYYILRPKFFM